MKRLLILAAVIASASCSFAELWEVNFYLAVPRVFDNTKSNGYRKYERERVHGYFEVEEDRDGGEPSIRVICLENTKHKVNGKRVTYDCYVENVLWHGVGSNRTGKFDTRSVTFSIVAEPSYAIGVVPTEDNSLYLTVGAKGNAKKLVGYAAGQQGCGCAEYGHVSPTRIWQTCVVRDTAGVYGSFRAKRREYVWCLL